MVRRVLQRHLNELRFCYERELASRPSLTGTVREQLVVAADGSVRSSTIASSSLGVPSVDACIRAAAERWTFPAPEGGAVVVTCPITLSPSSAP